MGKRIALLVGVSDYLYEESLSACEHDLALVSEILQGSGSYDDVVVIGDSPKSSVVKEKIAALVRQYEGEDIDEVFFYYTGHGMRRADDFSFIFSDFERIKSEQTSLRNSELDAMLKTLEPTLVVKVVDACQSGVEYVKSDFNLEDVLSKSAKSSFNKIYFLFSSSSTEPSIAYSDLSVFTKSFAECIAGNEGRELRYRDLMAYMADDLGVTKHQTPLFIQQANNIEVFFAISEELAAMVNKKLFSGKDLEPSVPVEVASIEGLSERESSLLSEVRLKAKDYCSKDDALAIIGRMIELPAEFDWGKALRDLYQIDSELKSEFYAVPGMDGIAKWLLMSEEPYFAEVQYSNEEYEVKEKVEIEESRFAGDVTSALFTPQKRIEYSPVTRYREVPNSIEHTAASPCCVAIISFSPNEEVLPWIKGYVGFMFSKRRLTLFCKHEAEEERSWESRTVENENDWKLIHAQLGREEQVLDAMRSALVSVRESIVEEVAGRLGLG